MNLLFIGDIVGKGGRNAVKALAPELRKERNCPFCVANGENMANGDGVNAKVLADLSGVVDVFTLGDHAWGQKDFEKEVDGLKNVLRPANFHPVQPGRGFAVYRNPGGGDVAVVSLQGKVFMKESYSCPFAEVERVLAQIPPNVRSVIVDFHAEATSEKIAMGYWLDGRVTAVIGTHTHVQTADAVVLPGGTAYISDAGMVGADRSVLGRDVDAVLRKFTTGMPTRLDVVEKGRIRLDAVVVSYDPATGKASGIAPVSRTIDI